MPLTDGEIERIAQLLFEKLMGLDQNLKSTENESQNIYAIYDDFGDQKIVDEKTFLNFEIERLKILEDRYVEKEEYEKADIIKNKILKIKLKIHKL